MKIKFTRQRLGSNPGPSDYEAETLPLDHTCTCLLRALLKWIYLESCLKHVKKTPWTARKCICMGGKRNPGQKNSSENCFLRKNCFFLPSVGKKQLFFLRKQKFSSESFCAWIPLSTHTEHIFLQSKGFSSHVLRQFPVHSESIFCL